MITTSIYVWVFAGIIAFILLCVFIKHSYVKAPPSIAYVISGVSKNPRVLIGKGGFMIPFFERMDKVYLGQLTVDANTDKPVPTNDFLDVSVDAVAKVMVKPDDDSIRLAAKNFLNMSDTDISNSIRDTLVGNLREVISAIKLKELNTNRDDFAKKVAESASVDIGKLGLMMLSFNLQNISDEKGLIRDLGADNVAMIQKNAKINRALAERDVAIETAKADKDSNDARVAADTAIAERNNELAIRKAELKIISDTKQADADNAYEIQNQERQKIVNQKTVDAEIEKTKREQELSKEKIVVKQNEFEAQVNKKADADKYQKEIDAKAELEQRKRKAEAERYEAEQQAMALKAAAEAKKYEKEQEALGIKALGDAESYKIEQIGLAEAKSIEAKGLAEAEAMQKKAEAYNKYGDAAKLDILVKVLPDMAQQVAKPLSAIDNVNIYGGGIDNYSANVPSVIKQTFDTVQSATGVNLSDIMRAETIEAKINKNINLDADTKIQK